MAKLTESLTIQTGTGESFNFNFAEDYTEVFNLRQKVDNSNSFITLLTPSTTIGQSSIRNAKSIVIRNDGEVGTEVQFKVTDYANNSNVDDANSIDISGDGASTTRYITTLLGAGEYMFLPNARWVSYEDDASAANAKPTTNGAYLTLTSDLEVDSGTTINDSGFEAADTELTVADSDYFRIGDLIQVGINDTTATRIEVMRVTAISTHTLTVERALHGTSAADKDSQTNATSGAVNGAKVYLPIFNTYGDYNDFSVVQTDASGRFGATNFFGYGRVADGTADGIVPGSVAGKFYEPGYQSFGLKGITASTNSGLSASTTYYLSVALNGGTTDKITFTTDANNTNFGGTNGVVQKLQNAINELYYNPAKNGFQDGASVGIVNGDIRITSHSRLSTSAVAITTNTDGTAGTDELFDGSNIIGRIPVSPAGAVSARLPDDTIINRDGVTVPNTGVFFYDDGHGNIKGTATGTINYQTGAIDFVGEANAQFAITANYDSAHGGGNNSTTNAQNMIIEISARSCNSKINSTVEIVAFD